MTLVCLTKGIKADIAMMQGHPESQYHECDVNEQYIPTSRYTNLEKMFYSTAKDILQTPLLEDVISINLVARVWIPWESYYSNYSTHDTEGIRSSDDGMWLYQYASLDKYKLYMAPAIGTSQVKYMNDEEMFYSVQDNCYIGSSALANSIEKYKYNMVFPGNKDMFRRDVLYIIPTSLLT